MRKLRRLLFALFVLGLLALAALFTVRTISFSSRQIQASPVEAQKVSSDALERLAGAVKLHTVSREGEMDTAAFLRLDTFFQKNYPLMDSLLEKETIAGFSYLFKWAGQNARLSPILLLAHLDVTPVETSSRERWQHPPFGGKIQDDYLWGRGTLDDKSGACGILEAVEMLLQTDYSPERSIFIAFGHDEEISGEYGAQQIVERLREQGIEFEFILDEGSMVVEDAFPGLEKPLALIGIAEKGYATLELSVNLEAVSHASMPTSETAIQLLSSAIVRLKNSPSPARLEGPVRAMFEHTGPEMGLLQKVLFANLDWTAPFVKWQFSQDPAANAMLRSTVAPTIVSGGFSKGTASEKDNMLPVHASALLNCRILPGESVESVTAYVRRTISDERVKVNPASGSRPSEPTAVSGTGTFGYQVLQTTIRQIFPEVVIAPSLVVGTTDSRHYQSVSKNIYRFLPVQLKKEDLKRLHGIDERIHLEQYRQTVRFFRQLILNSCK